MIIFKLFYGHDACLNFACYNIDNIKYCCLNKILKDNKILQSNFYDLNSMLLNYLIIKLKVFPLYAFNVRICLFSNYIKFYNLQKLKHYYLYKIKRLLFI